MLCVIQFSDLHFAPPEFRGYGGVGPDTGRTWESAVAQAFADDLPLPDRVIVTGDIAEHGDPAEYKIAADRFAELPVSANVLLGNHDFEVPAEAFLPSALVSMNRVERHGPWMFIYIDSNATPSSIDSTDSTVRDPKRVSGDGGVTASDLAWVRSVLDVSDAEYVWLWMHHTPGATGAFASPLFTREVADIVRYDDRIRGIGSGHVHNNSTAEIAGCPVYVCPSLTLNFDVDAFCTLPPGYREYTFSDDGSVVSRVVWVEMSDFSSFDLPAETVAHLKGDLSWDEMVRELYEKR